MQEEPYIIPFKQLKTDFCMLLVKGMHVRAIFYFTTRDDVPGITDKLHPDAKVLKNRGAFNFYWKMPGACQWNCYPMMPPKGDYFVFMPSGIRADTFKLADPDGRIIEEEAK
jgi:hypothetical protein